MSAERRAVLLMICFAALWALVEAVATHVMRAYSPYQVVWSRYAVHLLLMLAIWGWREPRTLWATRRPAFQFARSMLMLGMPAFWIMGMQTGHGAYSLMALFWLTPLVMLVLARVFLREAIEPWLWIAGAAASAGGMLMGGFQQMPRDPMLLVYPLGMALCVAGYVVMTRPLRHEGTRPNLFYSALGVFLVLTPAMPALWVAPALPDLAIFAVVGVLGYGCLYMIDRSTAAARVSITAPVIAMQVPFAALAVYFVGSVYVDRRVLAGLAAIVAAAAFVLLKTPGRAARPNVSHPA